MKYEAPAVNVQAIANGYIVSVYSAENGHEQWYAIDEQEVHEKMRKFLF